CSADGAPLAYRWRSFRSFQLPQQSDEAVDIRLVLVNPEADPQDVAAHIGDAVLGHELRIPALGVRAAEGKEARVLTAIKGIEQLGVGERGLGNSVKQPLLKARAVGGNARRRQTIIGEHPADRVEAVKSRGVEGGAEEAARVGRITDPSRGQAQVLEL